jgi:hypothetical protein
VEIERLSQRWHFNPTERFWSVGALKPWMAFTGTAWLVWIQMAVSMQTSRLLIRVTSSRTSLLRRMAQFILSVNLRALADTARPVLPACFQMAH